MRKKEAMIRACSVAPTETLNSKLPALGKAAMSSGFFARDPSYRFSEGMKEGGAHTRIPI